MSYLSISIYIYQWISQSIYQINVIWWNKILILYCGWILHSEEIAPIFYTCFAFLIVSLVFKQKKIFTKLLIIKNLQKLQNVKKGIQMKSINIFILAVVFSSILVLGLVEASMKFNLYLPKDIILTRFQL